LEAIQTAFALKRFPDLTPAQLLEAHAYAYGGCAIQDAGYYPFGNAFFSDLTHYVRTGDFIESLFCNAVTRDTTKGIPAALKLEILNYYADSTAPIVTKKSPKRWAQVQSELQILADAHENRTTILH
jgi:hypothetical protein